MMIRTQLITLLEIFHDLSFHFGVILEYYVKKSMNGLTQLCLEFSLTIVVWKFDKLANNFGIKLKSSVWKRFGEWIFFPKFSLRSDDSA